MEDCGCIPQPLALLALGGNRDQSASVPGK
ncbi:hypothetical protein ALQ30_200198 [Pseudomonas syringae pv. persicae]|uniref:Uncharacterized protein n=1 Tax=Pseudomonas syringae pv. persicae TaxID=237306 RepID=A0A3M4A2X6_9PSED|nr:hypothetical protein ALQ30_200198 [Pseudomonas syringae pv. persicae]